MTAESSLGKVIYVRVFSFIVLIGSIISLALCLLLDTGDKKIIALLPAAYGLLFLLGRKNRRNLSNICLSVINISAIMRYLVYPTIIAFTLNSGAGYSFDKKAVFFLVYELLGVFLIIEIFGDKLNVKKEAVIEPQEIESHIGLPNLSILMLLVPILVLFPSLITRFSISADSVKEASSLGVIEIVFTMGIWVLFIFLISGLSQFKDNSRSKNILGFILAAAVGIYYVLFNSISGSNVRRWQIISCGVAIIYILLKLFASKKKFILIFGTITILVSVIIGSFVKFGIEASFKNFVDEYLNLGHFAEYFGGMKNVTNAVNLFDDVPAAQGIKSTLTDLFSGFPILSALFDYDAHSTPAIFQEFMGRTDIICPLTAQSVTHFGALGTPVLAMIMTFGAIMFEVALKKTDNMYSAYVLVELIVYFSLFMELNTTIILGKLWIRLMFLALQPIEDRTRLKFVWRGA